MERGLFITFEGGDGAGKTTHLRFLAQTLEARGYEVVCLREPGGTVIGEQLRNIVLDPDNDVMCHESELLIYEAARAQLVAQVIQPALERGAVVLCDRYTDSTVAYQAFGRGMQRDAIDRANAFASRGIEPDRTILMLTGGDAEVGLSRAIHRGDADRLESAGSDFHKRVNAGYLELAASNPSRIRTVVSDGSKSQTARKVFAELADLFEWMADDEVCTEEFFANIGRRQSGIGSGN